MQKNRVPCIKTSDFAKMCGTNKRTLIHYDEIGLFSPAYTNALGYRFYSEDQCDLFQTILCLKDIGMPLAQIKAYTEDRSPDRLKALLLEQHQKIKAEIAHLHRIDQVIQTKIDLVSLSHQIDPGTVKLENCEDEYLVLSAAVDSSSHDVIIDRLYTHLTDCNAQKINSGYAYGAMLTVEAISGGNYDTYAYFFTKIAPAASRQTDGHAANHAADPAANLVANQTVDPAQSVESCYVKPRGRYAVTYLKGNYYEADEAFTLLITFIRERNLTMTGYVYKEAILDEIAVRSPEDFLTKISVAVV